MAACSHLPVPRAASPDLGEAAPPHAAPLCPCAPWGWINGDCGPHNPCVLREWEVGGGMLPVKLQTATGPTGLVLELASTSLCSVWPLGDRKPHLNLKSLYSTLNHKIALYTLFFFCNSLNTHCLHSAKFQSNNIKVRLQVIVPTKVLKTRSPTADGQQPLPCPLSLAAVGPCCRQNHPDPPTPIPPHLWLHPNLCCSPIPAAPPSSRAASSGRFSIEDLI